MTVLAVLLLAGGVLFIRLLTLPVVPSIVVCFLVGLAVDFDRRFLYRGLERLRQLKALEADLAVRLRETRTRATRGADHSTVVELDRRFEECGLKSVWEEFRESLHKIALESGEAARAGEHRWYQTAPSELFLTRSAVVDRPLSADFFKHLPGILTGLGIIATFTGLIGGLAGFEFAPDTDTVRTTVGELIGAVKEAFWVSAVAIGIAMLVTGVEKYVLEQLYQLLHRIQGAVNNLFHGVPQEEYLARIDLRSDESATELKNLRSGLVEEFTPHIENLASRLEQASMSASERIGQQLAGRNAESGDRRDTPPAGKRGS